MDRAAKANTDETTTNAINTMADSSPVIPFWSGSQAVSLGPKLPVTCLIVLFPLDMNYLCAPNYWLPRCVYLGGKSAGMGGCLNLQPSCKVSSPTTRPSKFRFAPRVVPRDRHLSWVQ